MPRYYAEHPRGYDLDYELPFIEIGGERCQVGSAGSLILCCPVCGHQAFREHVNLEHMENCFDGHGRMELVKLSDLESRWRPLAIANGIKLTTTEQRRADRLQRESERPWDWQFGTKTEADFPDGYAKIAA